MWRQQSVKFNLLKNPCGLDSFNQWNINANGGNGWKIENLPGDGGEDFPNPSVTKYFVTSFQSDAMSQLIDLKETGYSADIMDIYQPAIVVTDWYAARKDSGCDYQLLVRLLSEDKSSLQEFSPPPVVIAKGSGTRWQHITHTFSDYGPGVRYILFQHGGSDTQDWAGWYGVRMTNSSVSIEM